MPPLYIFLRIFKPYYFYMKQAFSDIQKLYIEIILVVKQTMKGDSL